MHFSLVVATRGRVTELEILFDSLAQQTYRDFAVILIDQNPDERLASVIERYKSQVPVEWVRTGELGASRARNLGLERARGELVTFPDDDCWYPDDLLERVVAFFQSHPQFSGLTGRVVTAAGKPTVGRWDPVPGEIDRFNQWTRSSECVIFARTVSLRSVDGFDPVLGPGSGTPWGANEGDDLILRALQLRERFYYDPSIEVFHPRTPELYDANQLAKVRAYGRGMGYVLRKHRFPLWFCTYWFIRSLGGLVAAALRMNWGRSRYFWAMFRGRLEGWNGQ